MSVNATKVEKIYKMVYGEILSTFNRQSAAFKIILDILT